MTDKLASYLGPEPRKLTVGKSFEKKSGSRYHGLRYDFKPVSIDEDKDGVLEVKENSSVAVSLPHIDGSGQTNYKVGD
ncbi:ELL-associated factor 2 [Eurytemora carolleeae]|uniref:ELL-associated factor 2 n=1 Tax=Eurytemora carolleeae TaxID=1294199 RepID=UPI000C78F7AC|nr:ELL-associated factor 2 [Eurytemora carolleeae]|eukprot:XP_023349558.1 ELL-associated factor 2-like [Eurytemora affinis]